MTKKTRHLKRRKQLPTSVPQVDRHLALVQQQIMEQDYEEAIVGCESLLSYLPQRARQRVEVLDMLGSAQTMQQNFPQSYAVYTEALTLAPEDAVMWFNRGMASRFTSRFGKSLRDYERAQQLNDRPDLVKKLEEELALARDLAEQSRKMRGPDFTLEQLIEQEDVFQNGLLLMEAGKWQEAEQSFQAAIAIRDCLPQPWGNLGISLIAQKRYDEAEAALRHALTIDPHYILAKENLSLLPTIRETDTMPMFETVDPFKNARLKRSITFLEE
ncbi:MAG TPA: tetratricopeptide repeat protein [Ktedonobacteraceae bacterium]|jgi:tetratricopeptide (TPR) repeat protein